MTTLLIDTDIQDDVDDVGALAVACALSTAGVRLAGVTVSTPSVWGARAATAVLRHYGVAAPVAIDRGEDIFGPEEYARGVSRVFGTDRLGDFGRPVALLRSVLASSVEPVTVVAVGFHSNLAALLASPADELSPLTGVDLVHQAGAKLVVMGGCFDPDGPNAEFNFAHAPAVTRSVFERWPGLIDVVPWEVGAPILTGADLLDHQGIASPVTVAYLLHSGYRMARPSWDPLTVLSAAGQPTPGLRWSEPGTVRIGPRGESTFAATAGGRHRIASLADDGTRLTAIINQLLYAPPTTGRREP